MCSKIARLLNGQPKRPGDEVELFWLSLENGRSLYSFKTVRNKQTIG